MSSRIKRSFPSPPKRGPGSNASSNRRASVVGLADEDRENSLGDGVAKEVCRKFLYKPTCINYCC